MPDRARSDITSRDDTELLVRRFYERARSDELLGPIFDAAELDWPAHIKRLTDFWAWQLLGHQGYGRNPLRAHEPVHARTPFEPAHYERWLDLFTTTVEDLFVGPVADAATTRAVKMANALERLMGGQSGAAMEATEVMIVELPTDHDGQSDSA